MAEPTNPRWPATKIRDLASSCIIGCGQLCWMLCSFTRFLGRPDKVSSARPCRRRGQDRQPRRGTDRQEAHDRRHAYRKLIIRQRLFNALPPNGRHDRSEERRAGKEGVRKGRSRWCPEQYKKKQGQDTVRTKENT